MGRTMLRVSLEARNRDSSTTVTTIKIRGFANVRSTLIMVKSPAEIRSTLPSSSRRA